MKDPEPQFTNPAFIEQMWNDYRRDPNAVDPSWRHFFMGVEYVAGASQDLGSVDHSTRVQTLIRAYRKWGHLGAQLDPLEACVALPHQLDLSHFGYCESDLSRSVPSCGFFDAPQVALGAIVSDLQKTYCGRMGIEYLDGPDAETEKWFQSRIEPRRNQPDLNLADKRVALEYLNEAELFERFIHTKYVGQKRFSLEGAEALIPTLAELIEALSRHGGREVIFGMSHRGRLNVLANIMGKTYEEIFSEFEPNYIKGSVEGDGDVKYHKGFVSDFETRQGGRMHLTLVDNPSHLEAVNAVVEGLARANQDRTEDGYSRVTPVLIHGDASFSGQGVVSETLNLSGLDGYRTGGTIHIVINNQIGFTTDPRDGRSTHYCTDIARQIMAPIFHVNGDDPELLIHAIRMAAEYRQAFLHDVVIDLVCYRRYGHNEGDEPSFTQPSLYKRIKGRSSTRKVYVEQLIQQGELEAKVARELETEFKGKLEAALEQARESPAHPPKRRGLHLHAQKGARHFDLFEHVDTTLELNQLNSLTQGLTQVPDWFHVHPKVKRLLLDRRAMVEQRDAIDWGMAEQLAYAATLSQAIPVRISGQDVKRGTFSHRHAVLFDVKDGRPWSPLSRFQQDGARLEVHNSPLSEFAVMGFEFGYSVAKSPSLVVWEAQFGDFVNGAQVIVDQFLASSESKWNLTSNLVLYLPHGYEGQGPEHSSGRLERFLQLCAEDNLQVANLTDPANLFHILRRQVLRGFRKPLVIMTPKSLLRHPRCTSPRTSFLQRGFRPWICDQATNTRTEQLICCSGKIYYELEAKRDSEERDVPILRLEQLYPLDERGLAEFATQLPNLKKVVWVQEEPENMGAWHGVRDALERIFQVDVSYIGRESAASPSAGSLRMHQAKQEQIINTAFATERRGVLRI